VDYVVLDTDVASLSFRRRLPAAVMAVIAPKLWCLSFVSVGEMTQWASLRSWSPLISLDRGTGYPRSTDSG
jgi:hypothetical protein